MSTMLVKAGPRLERCAWVPRKATESGSEDWYRFVEGGDPAEWPEDLRVREFPR